MLDSVRVRLTLWYTAVLTLVLIVLSLITYFIFWRSTLQRTDVNLSELSEAFLTTLDAEVKDQSGPDSLKLAGQVAITEHRFRDHVFAIFDESGKIVVSSQDVPPAAAATGPSAAGALSSPSFQRFLEGLISHRTPFRQGQGRRRRLPGICAAFFLRRENVYSRHPAIASPAGKKCSKKSPQRLHGSSRSPLCLPALAATFSRARASLPSLR